MARIRTIKPDVWTDRQTADGAPPYWIYCIAEEGEEETGPCKIGIATHLTKRLSSLQGGNRRPLNLIWQIRVRERDIARETEEFCLRALRPSPYSSHVTPRLQSEWLAHPPRKVLEQAVLRLNIDNEEVRRVA